MKIHPARQGTPEWAAARIGLPTASNFHLLITATGKASASAEKYLTRLATEWYLGRSMDEANSQFMQRGTGLESEAAAWYELERDVDTQAVGLCLRDDGKAGASPDRLVGEDGVLEIKCPGAETHMTYVLGGVANEYRCQIQGILLVTGRAWCDLLSYNPTLPKVLVRFERDEPFLATLSGILDGFINRLDAAKAKLAPEKAARDRQLQDEVPAELAT